MSDPGPADAVIQTPDQRLRVFVSSTRGELAGLEEEFELSAGMPRLMYVKAPAPDREHRLADLLSHADARTRDG